MASRYLLIFLFLTAASSLSRVLGLETMPMMDSTLDCSPSHTMDPMDNNTMDTMNNYTTGRQYQVNLAQVMASLQQGASNNTNNGFKTTTAGAGADMVFGLSMCYADRNRTECEKCIAGAVHDINQTCPHIKQVIACYNGCVLRYSHQSFFSVADLTIAFYDFERSYVGDSASMNDTWWELMRQLVANASASELRLANSMATIEGLQGKSHVISGVAQCTRDLNASQCVTAFHYLRQS